MKKMHRILIIDFEKKICKMLRFEDFFMDFYRFKDVGKYPARLTISSESRHEIIDGVRIDIISC